MRQAAPSSPWFTRIGSYERTLAAGFSSLRIEDFPAMSVAGPWFWRIAPTRLLRDRMPRPLPSEERVGQRGGELQVTQVLCQAPVSVLDPELRKSGRRLPLHMVPSAVAVDNGASEIAASYAMTSQEEAYDELRCYTLALREPSFIQQHVIDAFVAQHSNEQTKPIAIVFALVGLHLYLERGFSGRQVQRAHMQLARHKRLWSSFTLPLERELSQPPTSWQRLRDRTARGRSTPGASPYGKHSMTATRQLRDC
jgi:Family of unknown function (DUF5946)